MTPIGRGAERINKEPALSLFSKSHDLRGTLEQFVPCIPKVFIMPKDEGSGNGHRNRQLGAGTQPNVRAPCF